MSRSPKLSSLLVVPGCGMQTPPPHARLKAATPETVIGPVNVPVPAAQLTAKRQNWTVVLGMLIKRFGPVNVPVPAAQLTAKRQHWTAVLVMLIKRFGSLDGGKVEPSRSAGSRLAPEAVVTQACRAAPPTNIWARSKAQT